MSLIDCRAYLVKLGDFVAAATEAGNVDEILWSAVGNAARLILCCAPRSSRMAHWKAMTLELRAIHSCLHRRCPESASVSGRN